VFPKDGKINNIKKLYEYETPALRLGIFDKPITFKFLMEHYGIRYLPTEAKPVTPICGQIPFP
jgi:hypothetical protein